MFTAYVRDRAAGERRRVADGLALLLTSAIAVSACSEPVKPSESGGTPPLAPVDAPRGQTPAIAPEPARTASISTETLVLTLSRVPEHLRAKPLSDAAWRAWTQATVGPDVRVMGVRALGSDGEAAPSHNTPLLIAIAPTTEERIRAARAHAEKSEGDVARVEIDPIWSSQAVPNDPRFGEQWHWPKIQAPQAWDVATGSPNVVVAVIDTGVDTAHPDLAAAIWTNPYDAPDGQDNDGNGLVDDVHGWNFVSRNADLTDQTGHGTHLAGLIAAQRNDGSGVAGIASGVKIMPLVVGALAPASAVIEAIYYAATHGAHVVNMSFGGSETISGVRGAIDYARARGVLLVASAGNASNDAYNYPAVYQDVLAVAATDLNDRRAMLSSYGRWVDISAPGQDVLSTFPLRLAGNGYAVVSGTSQATPIVAGVAALLKSLHPEWSADQIRAQILATADELSTTNPDYVGLLGAGRVNAARAVGPAVSSARAYLAGVTVAESTGDGDQRLGAGETGSVAVSLHFTAGAESVAASLTSSDQYVTVTSGPVGLTAPRTDRTQTARFQVSVAANVPRDHVAKLSLALTASGTTTTFAVPVAVAPTYRQLTLPFAYEQNLLPAGDGKLLLVADAFQSGAPVDRVYASFRNADGTFSPEVSLSDPTLPARKPHAIVDPNGDVHVAFYQAVQLLEFAAFPSYAKYTAATGSWSTSLLFGGEHMVGSPFLGLAGEANNIALARDSGGVLHMAFTGSGKLVLNRQTDGGWETLQTFPYPAEGHMRQELDLVFATVDGGLKLFVHPIWTPTTVNGSPPDATRPVQLLAFDGTMWSAPISLGGGVASEKAQLPFVVDGAVRRFFQPSHDTGVFLAELNDGAWGSGTPVQDIGSAMFRSSFGGLVRTGGSLVTVLARPVAATFGSVRELRAGGQLTPLAGDTTRRAAFPVMFDAGGTLHAFVQERRLHRAAGDSWSETPESTSYYTQAPLAATALPTTPIVVDDGSTTTNPRMLHARWSSAHPAGIASYRVAWGTAPGKDDLVPWTLTTATEMTVDLNQQRLLPGQTAYASVQARSRAVLSSGVGVSDGITLADLCTAPPWNATVAYQEPGALVTYEGATYRNLYWSSGSTPTNQYGAWQLVASCVGAPELPACVKPTWTSGRVYPAGSRVSHDGMELVAQWATDTAPTGAAGNPWRYVASCNP